MSDLISREALKKAIEEYKYCGFYDKVIEIIDNAPTVKPCDNCDLYFKAMTKEEMRKSGADWKGGADNDVS